MAYLYFRRCIELMAVFMSVLIAVRIGESTGMLSRINILESMNMYIDVGSHIAGNTMITVAGAICSMFLIREGKNIKSSKLFKWTMIFSSFLALEGYCFQKFGINKSGAKISWALYSSGICMVFFAIIFYIVDICKISLWTMCFNSAGKNPLLAFLLPPLIHPLFALLGINIFNFYVGYGIAGIFCSIIFTAFILLLTWWLSRLGISLRL